MNRSVVIVIESLGGGGAQHVASTLANYWAANGIAVACITFSSPASDVFKLENGVRRIVIGGAGISNNSFMGVVANALRIRNLRSAIRDSGAGTVLSFVGSTNILSILAAARLGKRVIVSERNDPARQSLGRIWDLLRRLLYSRADLVIANSRAAISTMTRYVGADKLAWLPNPVRNPGPSLGPLDVRRPFFLAAGRLDAQKAYDVLLTAFAQVAASRSDVDLVILGQGPLRAALMAQARSLGISDRVVFKGHVDDPFPWYRAAIALAHPARFEGMPNAVLEAMSVGLPPVISDAQEGLRDIVHARRSGLVVPEGSAPALATAMIEVDEDSELRARLSAGARLSVEVQLSDALERWTDILRPPAGN